METHTLDQRRQFIHALVSAHWSMTDLCARFGVPRPAGSLQTIHPFAHKGPGLMPDPALIPDS